MKNLLNFLLHNFTGRRRRRRRRISCLPFSVTSAMMLDEIFFSIRHLSSQTMSDTQNKVDPDLDAYIIGNRSHDRIRY